MSSYLRHTILTSRTSTEAATWRGIVNAGRKAIGKADRHRFKTSDDAGMSQGEWNLRLVENNTAESADLQGLARYETLRQGG